MQDGQTTRAGAYRLIRHIASGGMGVVYLAERDDGQVRHQAAVKILRRGLDAEDQIRRFTAERQILATLDHPGIARLIDAGITDDHRPYFVMEYVEGEPIDRYCDSRRLSVRERVALIRDVARAVDYAHRKLIVHRDLKPSNILVTRDGQVKLLDFGIAKLLDTDSEETTSITGPGVRLMTPGYASPEQMTGGSITTATDVYVLGLLLYELLTGTRAQDPEGRSFVEMQRLVVERDLPRPSEVLARTEAPTASAVIQPTRIAEFRRTTPARLRRLLRGDLDRIVAMAARKEPERRYSSAEALADDLDRFLKDQPVLARGESTAYRVAKFMRRRWPAVAAGLVFLAMLVAYAVTVTLQARQIAAERDRAQAEQRKAEEVTAFLERMFQASDPSETRGDTITARELLERGVRRADTLAGQPEAQAQLLDVMGRVYQSLGAYDSARPLLERSLAVRRATLGDTHPSVGDSLSHLGDLLYLMGKYEEAEGALRQALAIHDATAGRESAAAATDLHLLGAVLVDRGDPRHGRALFEKALDIRRRVLAPEDPDIAESLSGLAYAASEAGEFEEMERRHGEALALLRKAFGDRHPRIALGLNNLAVAVDNRGRYEEAARLHREALAMRRELFGSRHPAVATSLNNLGNVLQKQGRYAEAEPLAREVVELRRELLGADHPSTAIALNNLAILLFRSERPAEAEAVMRESIRIASARLGANHPSVLIRQTGLASMIAALGRHAEAETLFKRAHAARLAALGPDHPEIAGGLVAYGRFLTQRRRFREAQPMLEQAVALRTRVLGADHPETKRAVEELEAMHRASGQRANPVPAGR